MNRDPQSHLQNENTALREQISSLKQQLSSVPDDVKSLPPSLFASDGTLRPDCEELLDETLLATPQ